MTLLRRVGPGGRRLLWSAAALFAVLLAYETVTSVIAYTADAYVRSDLIAVTPEVTGRIIAVHVRDNQTVRHGDPLVTIDPEPFQLVVDQQQAEVRGSQAQDVADTEAVRVAQAALDAASANLAFARTTQGRLDALGLTGDVSRQQVDQGTDQLRRAQDELAGAQSAVAQANQVLLMHRAAAARNTAELATAVWRLSQTAMTAPADGIINNLNVRVGDTAVADTPLIGIVDAHAWRIIANYRQSYIRSFQVGQTAWVWLDSKPWHFYRARIEGIARAISRDPGGETLLPYVPATTDWIRLQRRFPVTLVLTDPPDALYMGADARTVIFP
jgi:membrane fusion protein, multidrug efflux system